MRITRQKKIEKSEQLDKLAHTPQFYFCYLGRIEEIENINVIAESKNGG
jgi:hypothetical protein